MVYSPFSGRLVPLSHVSDNNFARGLVGKGYAVEPNEGRLYAPVTGTVVAINSFGYAYTIKALNPNGAGGAEAGPEVTILIHIGIKTWKLSSKHFRVAVGVGEQVTAGICCVNSTWMPLIMLVVGTFLRQWSSLIIGHPGRLSRHPRCRCQGILMRATHS